MGPVMSDFLIKRNQESEFHTLKSVLSFNRQLFYVLKTMHACCELCLNKGFAFI